MSKDTELTDEFYTPTEVSKLLKVSRPTVYKWIEAGIVQGVRIGGTVRVPRVSVLAAIKNIEAKEQAAAAQEGE